MTPSWPLVSWLPHVSTGLSLFLSTPTFLSDPRKEKMDEVTVDEGWNSCWREEKVAKQILKNDENKVFVINSNKRLFTQLFK